MLFVYNQEKLPFFRIFMREAALNSSEFYVHCMATLTFSILCLVY